MSPLHLLVLLALLMASATLLAGLAYVTYEHPALVAPLSVVCAAAAVLAALIIFAATRR
ncbi:hypothetical protein ACN6LF_001383 [[Kitasatospora] papulosa]|uniref:hypothetical protein n=1 Tax=[Kitasatospora] papulosa TaxID=1464011 RepID=UPI00403C968E